jgi:hypothetical protein
MDKKVGVDDPSGFPAPRGNLWKMRGSLGFIQALPITRFEFETFTTNIPLLLQLQIVNISPSVAVHPNNATNISHYKI